MRAFLLPAFLYLASFPVHGQRVVIAADRMNVCYIGVENPMSAAAFGCTEKNLVLRTGNGYFVNAGGGKFIYNPAEPGVTIIFAYCLKGRDSVPLGQFPFRVRELPTPRPYVGNKSGGYIKKSVLLAQLGIEARLEGFDFDARFIVTSYDFSIRRSDGSVSAPVAGTSAYFSPEVKTAMQTLSTGDQVILDSIQCIGPDKRTRNCGTLTLVVE